MTSESWGPPGSGLLPGPRADGVYVKVARLPLCESHDAHPDRRLLHLLMETARVLGERLRRWHASRGVPTFAHATLGLLMAPEGALPKSPSDLAASLGITTGTMTHRLNVLERLGLVTRERVGTDGRRRLVSLTPRGVRVFEKISEQRVQFEAELLKGVAPNQRPALAAGLLALLARQSDRAH